jgi:hypothetical protein
MNRKGVEFTVVKIEPGVWTWQFQMGKPSRLEQLEQISWLWQPAERDCGLTENSERCATLLLTKQTFSLFAPSRAHRV